MEEVTIKLCSLIQLKNLIPPSDRAHLELYFKPRILQFSAVAMMKSDDEDSDDTYYGKSSHVTLYHGITTVWYGMVLTKLYHNTIRSPSYL
jgi:hypothetical protein